MSYPKEIFFLRWQRQVILIFLIGALEHNWILKKQYTKTLIYYSNYKTSNTCLVFNDSIKVNPPPFGGMDYILYSTFKITNSYHHVRINSLSQHNNYYDIILIIKTLVGPVQLEYTHNMLSKTNN